LTADEQVFAERERASMARCDVSFEPSGSIVIAGR